MDDVKLLLLNGRSLSIKIKNNNALQLDQTPKTEIPLHTLMQLGYSLIRRASIEILLNSSGSVSRTIPLQFLVSLTLCSFIPCLETSVRKIGFLLIYTCSFRRVLMSRLV